MKGLIVYDGPSMLDSRPIVAILTHSSTNTKTGPMAQLWILVRNTSPVHAAKEGADAAVCGRCMHRPANAGGCYVILHQAPTAVWMRFAGGHYRPATSELLRQAGRSSAAVRLGAYGDPMALPLSVVESVARAFPAHTGYTHQWMLQREDRARWQALLMASVDSPAGAAKAQREGWRTFRVRTSSGALAAGETVCPASTEAQNEDFAAPSTTCLDCMKCGGTACESSGHIAIIVHGSKNRLINFINRRGQHVHEPV